MRSPSASTISFSADSSVTLKKCLSSGSLAIYLISLRKASGLIPRRLQQPRTCEDKIKHGQLMDEVLKPQPIKLILNRSSQELFERVSEDLGFLHQCQCCHQILLVFNQMTSEFLLRCPAQPLDGIKCAISCSSIGTNQKFHVV